MTHTLLRLKNHIYIFFLFFSLPRFFSNGSLIHSLVLYHDVLSLVCTCGRTECFLRSLFLQIILSAPSQRYDRSMATKHKDDTRRQRIRKRTKWRKRQISNEDWWTNPLDRYSTLADILSKIISRIRESMGVDIRLIRDLNSITTFRFQIIRLSLTLQRVSSSHSRFRV